jgi:hypothetical protein
MRLTSSLLLTVILALTGCAYEGTVVRKDFRLVPFSESLGIVAIYKFELRDKSGQIHTQMVTPEVFATYAVGDYFNDLQIPGRAALPAPPEESLPPVPRRGPTEEQEIPYQPIGTSRAR